MWTEVVEKVFQCHETLGAILQLLELPSEADKVITFCNGNLARLKEHKSWSVRAKLTNSASEDMAVDLTIRLTWLVLSLGRILNNHLVTRGKKHINFVKEATEYDKSQQAGGS